MALKPGTSLGPYEVRGLLGAGGMGEVYRAHDANLRRDVAIKVLPASVAALTHPNILAIHDFDNCDGVYYAVTELLAGETLRDILDRGPLAIAKAVSVTARQLTPSRSKVNSPKLIR